MNKDFRYNNDQQRTRLTVGFLHFKRQATTEQGNNRATCAQTKSGSSPSTMRLTAQ